MILSATSPVRPLPLSYIGGCPGGGPHPHCLSAGWGLGRLAHSSPLPWFLEKLTLPAMASVAVLSAPSDPVQRSLFSWPWLPGALHASHTCGCGI